MNEKCDVQTLFTVGLSDRRLPQGRASQACSELHLMLPPEWPLTEDALQNAQWNWPVEWLNRMVTSLRVADRWPDPPAVFMNGDPPSSLAPNTALSGWLCMKSESDTIKGPDFRYIDLHSIFPIYTEDRVLIERDGHEELVSRFQAREVPLHVDPRRPNVALV